MSFQNAAETFPVRDEESTSHTSLENDSTSEKKSLEDIPSEKKGGQSEFPEGGLRAWLVVFGTAAVLFSTFGYANAFG